MNAGHKKREESNIIPKILATGKMEETEGESSLEGYQDHRSRYDKFEILFRYSSGDVK